MLAIEIKTGEKSNQFSYGIKGRGRWITMGGSIDLIDCEQSLIFLLSHRRSRARVRCERNEGWSPSVEHLTISEERKDDRARSRRASSPWDPMLSVPPARPTAPPPPVRSLDEKVDLLKFAPCKLQICKNWGVNIWQRWSKLHLHTKN